MGAVPIGLSPYVPLEAQMGRAVTKSPQSAKHGRSRIEGLPGLKEDLLDVLALPDLAALGT